MVPPTGRLLPRCEVGVLAAGDLLENLLPKLGTPLSLRLSTRHYKRLAVPATSSLRRTQDSLGHLTRGQPATDKPASSAAASLVQGHFGASLWHQSR